MTLDVPHTAAHTLRVMFGDTATGGPSGAPTHTGESLQALRTPARPETVAERKARRTAYLGDWPRIMAEHAAKIREREGR